MLRPINLGDFTGTTTGASHGVADLEPGTVYGSVGGTFVGTMQIEVSFNGSTFEQYGTDVTSNLTLFGPLPAGVKLVRGKCSAFTSGTIKVRAGGNVKRDSLLPVGQSKGGAFGDIVPTTASQSQTITCVAVASLAAGGGTNDYFGVTLGGTTVTFEYKVDGNFVAVANRTAIDVSAVSSSTEVAVATATAIRTAFTTATVPVPTSAVLTVAAPSGSTVLFTEHVSNAGYLLGAINYGVPVAFGSEHGIPQVWINPSAFSGTYAIQLSFDGGETFANWSAPVAVTGATSTLVTLPCRATHVRIGNTAYTSGTLTARYGAAKETQV